MLDAETRRAIEFDSFLQVAADLADTAGGKRAVLAAEPLDEPQAVGLLQGRTSEARRWVDELRPSLAGLEDSSTVLRALEIEGLALDPPEIQIAAAWIGKAAELRSALQSRAAQFPLLWSYLQPLADLSGWVRSVSQALDSDGQVLDSASPRIARIRKAIAAARERLNRILEKYFSSESLQDAYVTERGGRYVVPVRAERRESFKGVMHGSSSSGATVFVEPLEAVEWNNNRANLLEEEASEERRILGELSDALRARREDFCSIVDAVHDLDIAIARGRLSVRHQAVAPMMVARGFGLRLVQARHPLLIHFLGWEHVVPVDLELGNGTDILVVSGPNAGGKTVALKTAGLLCAVAQCGFHVPAVEAVLPVFSQIRADIGDHQSLQGSLSTFSSHILRMRAIVDEAGPGMLVLLDELGTATDPAQGAALGIALLDVLRRRGALVLATTHLERLKGYAAEQDFAENLAMEFDMVSLRPTFRLLRGLAGQSNALNIARRLGLQVEVLEAATTRMLTQDLDLARYMDALQTRIESLDRDRAALEAESRKLARERDQWRQEREAMGRDFRAELERRLDQVEREFEASLGKELVAVRDGVQREQMRRARRERAGLMRQEQLLRVQSPPRAPGPEAEAALPLPNSIVSIGSLGRSGIFKGLEGRHAVVEVEGKRLMVPVSDLRQGSVVEPTSRLPENVRFVPARAEGAVLKEMNLIGQNVDDAIAAVDKFLDAAFLEGYGSVRLIHGRGTGRLGKGLREFLAGHPHVLEASPAPNDQGGSAVTIVKLRD